MKLISFLCFVVLSLLSSCYYDSEEDLYAGSNCDTANVSFATSIQPVLDANCISCHSSALSEAGVNLETYNTVLPHVNSGILWKAVNHEPGVTPMPYKQPKLPECELLKIRAWINQGALNN